VTFLAVGRRLEVHGEHVFGARSDVPDRNLEEPEVRILLADDRQEVRSALRLLLQHEEGMSVVAEAAGLAALQSLLAELHPDVVLLDWELGGIPGSALVEACRSAFPEISIVALSGRVQNPAAVLAAGADGFVGKNESPEQLLQTLRRVSRGGSEATRGGGAIPEGAGLGGG
jgi:DNA-binding NarL/FixJ family response regulator